ncbi:fluoride efflux transporter FluC [Metabacillus mangrovi]|nr:CrcB family protein [Metabacillus mangrovi]
MIVHLLLLAAGGFIGSLARFAASTKWNGPFPKGTLAVNILGALLIGILAGAGMTGRPYLFAATGFLGAFTTFSTLNLELAEKVLAKQYKSLILYAVCTYAGGLGAAFAGYWLAKGLLGVLN